VRRAFLKGLKPARALFWAISDIQTILGHIARISATGWDSHPRSLNQNGD